MVSAIPRTAWQDPAKPIVGPLRRKPFGRGVVHWEGANRDQTPADIARHLRMMQASYLAQRGYSLGYAYAVVSDARHPQDGTRWEIRGTDINIASNPGRRWSAEGRQPAGNVNDWTGSVLLIGPTGVRASAKAAASVREIFAEWHAEAGTPRVRPYPHSVTDFTSCCGDAFRSDLDAGRFDPAVVAAPPPPPTPTPVPPTQGVPDVFYPINPHRNSDTRGFGGTGVAPNADYAFKLDPAVFPVNVVAVAVNVVALGASASGEVTVWPQGYPQPNTSMINFKGDGGAYNGAIVVGVQNGQFLITTTATCHLICDVTGFWTP